MDMSLIQQAIQALAADGTGAALSCLKNADSSELGADQVHEWLTLFHSFYQLELAGELAGMLATHPRANTPQLLSAARIFFENGNYRIAKNLTHRANELAPDDPDILAMLASCIERDGSRADAIPYLEKSLELAPGHVRSVRLLARIERRVGRVSDARARLERQIQNHRTDQDWRIRYELAAVLDGLALFREAMHELELAKNQLLQRVPVREAHATTRKRWEVALMVDAGRFSTWSKLALPPETRRRICVMAGFPRSGTTLLESVLTSHALCIGTDESGILHQLYERPLLLDAASAMSAVAELDSFDADDLLAGRKEYLRCTEAYLGEPVGERWLIEKEPLLTSYLALVLRLFPEAKVLMPLRDPRDVVISYYFTMVPLAASCAAAVDLGETCRHYAEVMRHWLHWKKILPCTQWLESRYEDLIDEPEIQTRKVADFLSLTRSPEMLAHHENRQKRTVSTPTYDDVSKPLYRGSIGRWKNYRDQLAPHLHHLQPYIEAFGYDG